VDSEFQKDILDIEEKCPDCAIVNTTAPAEEEDWKSLLRSLVPDPVAFNVLTADDEGRPLERDDDL
jgi:hypothetical protein